MQTSVLQASIDVMLIFAVMQGCSSTRTLAGVGAASDAQAACIVRHTNLTVQGLKIAKEEWG